MRKGFSITEIIVSCVLVGALVAFGAPLIAGLLGGLGKSSRAIQTDVSLCHMLKRLRQDVDGARSLTLRGGTEGESEVLLIESDGELIRYEIRERRVIRRSGPEQTSWPTAGGTVKCRIWARTGEPIALEVRTCVSTPRDALRKEKLVRTHVLFPGGLRRRSPGR